MFSVAFFISFILQLQICLVCFYDFFVEFLILLMYCFPACWVLCFIVAHWVSLEQLIWIIYQVNHRILSLSSVTRGLLRSFCDVTFHWFLMFLGVLHCCFLIWSSHLLQTLLVAFRSEILFIGPAYNWGFLCPCSNTCAPYFLAPCERNLKLLCLLSTLQLTRLAAGNLFCFSSDNTIAQVCDFSLATDSGLFSACCLPKLVFTAILGNIHKELPLELRELWV